MGNAKIQWHPGFAAAMNLELKEYREGLIFEKEYNLNTKPLEIDLLIIKKEASIHIENDIGSFFRGHNILEYKSPEDSLDIDVFYKSEAYAGLYKSYGETINAVKADDITVTILRDSQPRGLFRNLKEHGNKISSCYRGIYYIEGNAAWFPTQIIVTKELDKNMHIWLRALSGRLDKNDVRNLLKKVDEISEKWDKEMARSVLAVSIEANKQAVRELARGERMLYETLMEILGPQITEKLDEAQREGRKEGRKEGIQGTIKILRNFNHQDSEVKRTIMEQYSLTEDEAEEYLKI